MPTFSIPRFLKLGEKRLLRKQITLKIKSYALGTDLFTISIPEELQVDIGKIDKLVNESHELASVRALHTLGTAERAVKIFRECSFLPVKWANNVNRMTLFPFRNFIENPDQNKSSFAEYIGSSAKIEFDYFDRIINGKILGPSACLSHDIVVHEICHAILHGVKGWLDKDVETRALTESLGDILAMFSAGRHKEARLFALKECQGSFSNESNILSKFGEIPGTSLFLRDGSQKTNLSEVDKKPYPLSKVLTSALYEAFSTYLEEISGSHTVQEDILLSLTELSRAVFSSVVSLPNESVSLNHFALEMVRQSTPAFSLHLKKALKDRGFNLSSGMGEDIIAAMSPLKLNEDQSFKESHNKLLFESLGAKVKIANRIEIKSKKRQNFPTKNRICLNLDLIENDYRIGTACLTLNHQSEPLSIYHSRFAEEKIME